MRWPSDTSLRPVAAGTAEAGQPDRDRAGQGGDPAGSVIFHVARAAAGPARRPLGGMVPALRRDNRLLNPGQKLLAFCVRQSQSRQIPEITGAVDLQHVDAARRTVGPALHQAQYPSHS